MWEDDRGASAAPPPDDALAPPLLLPSPPPPLSRLNSASHGQRKGEPSAKAALTARKMSRTITSSETTHTEQQQPRNSHRLMQANKHQMAPLRL